jgi:hypothetical protein
VNPRPEQLLKEVQLLRMENAQQRLQLNILTAAACIGWVMVVVLLAMVPA